MVVAKSSLIRGVQYSLVVRYTVHQTLLNTQLACYNPSWKSKFHTIFTAYYTVHVYFEVKHMICKLMCKFHRCSDKCISRFINDSFDLPTLWTDGTLNCWNHLQIVPNTSEKHTPILQIRRESFTYEQLYMILKKKFHHIYPHNMSSLTRTATATLPEKFEGQVRSPNY